MTDRPTTEGAEGPGAEPEVALAIERHRFRFADDLLVTPVSRLFGVRVDGAFVELSGLTFRARFGPWLVETPIDNVVGTEVTGPYNWFKVAGPAHWSLHDHGLTFASSTRAGVLVEFRDPVRGLDALGLFRHPNLTVTVAEPERLVGALEHVREDADVIERDELDQLQAKTARELRILARQHGIRASSLKKDELVEALDDVMD